ncbi:MAG: hypothetical protein CVU05_07640 [Bacteroidetes bacterium HGW-Bacteroidetes-21]|jgi:hypothetical protein|nr:MAG: hypothetical protein CVU05_07640 [Bacteroidetes bacterium HGW-Bacteroidetes-21]
MKTVLSLLLILCISSALWAEKVSIETARKAAINLYMQKKSLTVEIPIKDILVENSKGKDNIYTFLFQEGFVSIAADDAITPVIAYSLTGSFDKNNMPPAMIYWLDGYSRNISEILSRNPENKSNKQKWDELLNGNYRHKSTLEVLPLCTTKWDQGCYYNTLCPADTLGPCDHAVTGCVATAMAQIMKYWNYPSQGQGTHDYNSLWYGNLTANFAATHYDWPSMPDSVGALNPAVATLMYHCGVSVEMDYYATSSSSHLQPQPLVDYFKYSANIKHVYNYSYSTLEWIELMKAEANAGRPVWYAGYPLDTIPMIILPGHAWVCDGYDDNDFLHFNWGWGSLGAYCEMGNFYYYLNNEAVINIMPVSNCDIAIRSLYAPVSKTFTIPEPIKIKVANFDTVAITNIPVAYQIDGGPMVRDTIYNALAANHDTIFQFAQTFDFSIYPGHIYNVKVFSALSCDTYNSNDTMNFIIENVLCSDPSYSMGFEPSESFTGWAIEDANADGNTWTIGSAGGNTAPYCAYYTTNSNNASEWLISKCIQLEAGKMYKLSFWYKSHGTFWPENMSVYMGNECESTAMNTQLADLTSIVNSNYLQNEVYFSVPATGSYYFGWFCYSESNMLQVVIDDILITEQISPDAGLISMNIPENACDLGLENIGIQIRNYCSSPISNIPMSYSINGGSLINDVIATTINPGAFYDFNFSVPANLSAEGLYNIKVYCSLPGDTLHVNDTLEINVYNNHSGNAPYSMEFETSDDFSSWLIINNNNDFYTWHLDTSFGNTHQNCMIYEYNYQNIPADDWIISECMSIESGKTYKLSFATKIESNQWPENLAVHIGTTPDIAGMNTLLLDLPQLTNMTYEFSDVYFTVPATGLYYFGWHCYSDPVMFNLYLDDINLTEVPVNAEILDNEYFSVYPNPFNTNITIETTSGTSGSIELIDVNGNVLIEKQISENRSVFDLTNLSSGVYFVKVIGANNVSVKKVVKR